MEGLRVSAVAAALSGSGHILLFDRCHHIHGAGETLRQSHQNGIGCQMHQTHCAWEVAIYTAENHVEYMAEKTKQQYRHSIGPAIGTAYKQDKQANERETNTRHLPEAIVRGKIVGLESGLTRIGHEA